jgi:hypothetical protein
LDYLKGCNTAQVIAGGIVAGASGAFAIVAVGHAGSAMTATSLAETFGVGTAAGTGATMSTLSAGTGYSILQNACR